MRVSRSLWEFDLPTGNPSIRISEAKALNYGSLLPFILSIFIALLYQTWVE